jgi:hypothetical protein
MHGVGKKGHSNRNQQRAQEHRHVREVRQLVNMQTSKGTRIKPTLTYNEVARGIQRGHNAALEPQATKDIEDYDSEMEAAVQKNIEDERAQ